MTRWLARQTMTWPTFELRLCRSLADVLNVDLAGGLSWPGDRLWWLKATLSVYQPSVKSEVSAAKTKSIFIAMLYETKLVFPGLPNCDRQIAQPQKYTTTRAGGVAGALLAREAKHFSQHAANHHRHCQPLYGLESCWASQNAEDVKQLAGSSPRHPHDHYSTATPCSPHLYAVCFPALRDALL